MSNMSFDLPIGEFDYPDVSTLFAWENTNTSLFGDADATLLASRAPTGSAHSPDEFKLPAVDPSPSYEIDNFSTDNTTDSQPLEAVPAVSLLSDVFYPVADASFPYEERYSRAMPPPAIPPSNVMNPQFRWLEYVTNEGVPPIMQPPQNAFPIGATNPYSASFAGAVGRNYQSSISPQPVPPARTPASSSVWQAQLAPVGPNQAPNNSTLPTTRTFDLNMAEKVVDARKRKNNSDLVNPGKTKHQKTALTATTSNSTAYQMLPPPLPATPNAQATSTTPWPAITELIRTVTIVSVNISGYPPTTFIIPHKSRAAFWVTRFLTAEDIFLGKIPRKVYLIKCKPKSTGSQDPVENFAVFQADMDPKNAVSVDLLRPYRCATRKLANKEETVAYWQRVLDIKAAIKAPGELR